MFKDFSFPKLFNPLAVLIFFAATLFFTSCSAPRNLVYLSDLNDTAAYKVAIQNKAEPLIQPGDILSISVSNVDPESSNLFNRGVLPAANNNNVAVNSVQATAENGYLVDKNGNVTFPAIGKVALAGTSLEEAASKVQMAISSFAKEPIVNVRFLNFKITVIGEVNRPGVFNVANNRVNVLEALGLAGDMTMYGRRDDVWIMHEQNGQRTVTHINLNSKNVLQSPAFYLQQNDVVYVKPDKLKEKQARTDTRSLSIIVAAATVITVIISRLF